VTDQKVAKIRDFLKDNIVNADGYNVPKEDFLFLELENGDVHPVRDSDIEPKIKFYIFCNRASVGSGNMANGIEKIKSRLDSLKSF
jgi:phosphomannomutase